MITDIIGWWYGAGLRQTWQRVNRRAVDVLQTFSVGLLLRTLFAPFRQIDAGVVNGSFDVEMRAFFDRTFSRVFGFVIRSFTIVAGLVCATFVAAGGVVWALVWLMVPLLPLAGFVLMMIGWTA